MGFFVFLCLLSIASAHKPKPPKVPPPAIPSNLKYFGYWAANDPDYKGFNNINFYFDWPTNVDLVWDSKCGPQLQCMPIVSDTFLDSSLNLRPDYKQRWAAVAKNYTVRLKQSKLLGFMLGDELLQHGASLTTVKTMANTIRDSFPRSTGVIIWISEEPQAIQAGKLVPIPDSIDWVSTDVYRGGPWCDFDQCTFVDTVMKPTWGNIMNNLASHQHAVITTGGRINAGDCNRKDCDNACELIQEIWDGYCTIYWAAADPRIIAVTAYLWKDFPPEYGLMNMAQQTPGSPVGANLHALWEGFGNAIKANTPPPPKPPNATLA